MPEDTRTVVALVSGSHVVNHAYMMLLPPLFPILSERLGLSDPQLGLALGTLGATVVALQLPFGYLSDVRGRDLVLAGSLAVGAVGATLTALATDFWTLLGAQVVLGIGVAGHHPAHYPLIGAATTPGTRGRAYSVHGFAGAIGFAVPPAVVAATTILGFDWRFAVGAIAACGAGYAVFAAHTAYRRIDDAITRPMTDEPPSAGVDSTEGSDASSETLGTRLHSVAPILALTVLWFGSSVAGWAIKQYTATLLAAAPYGLATSTANLVVAAMLTVGAVAILAGGWVTDRTSPAAVLVGGYLALAAVAGALAWGGLPVAGAVLATLALSATVDAGRPARAALGDRFSTAASAGRSFGLLTVGISGGAAVAPPVFGVVVQQYGVAAAFTVVAGLGILAVGLTGVVLGVARLVGTPGPSGTV